MIPILLIPTTRIVPGADWSTPLTLFRVIYYRDRNAEKYPKIGAKTGRMGYVKPVIFRGLTTLI